MFSWQSRARETRWYHHPPEERTWKTARRACWPFVNTRVYSRSCYFSFFAKEPFVSYVDSDLPFVSSRALDVVGDKSNPPREMTRGARYIYLHTLRSTISFFFLSFSLFLHYALISRMIVSGMLKSVLELMSWISSLRLPIKALQISDGDATCWKRITM